MEVVAANPNNNGVSPFHNHDVREWSRIDSLTGILERARLETDHWTASTSNTSHKYGKVVDSRARSGADGSLQQQARRQLEVFQSQIPGGRLQVIKTQTVSSSRWTNKSSSSIETKDFENLQLPLNPLDLTSEKSKASVGRSVTRRPPSRSRVREELNSNNIISDSSTSKYYTQNLQNTASTNLHRVSRLCHQVHENACREAFGTYFNHRSQPQRRNELKQSQQQHQQQQQQQQLQQNIEKRQNGDGSESLLLHEIETENDLNNKSINGHTNLIRTKSTSSEDLLYQTNLENDKTKSIEDLEDLEQLRNWRRTSKIRRSLQFPKQNYNKNQSTRPPDLPQNTGSVRKIREDLETGRRLNTALRGNNVDLEALDQILQSISSSSSIYSDNSEQQDKDTNKKRNSFVTVETLKEVKGRLRRTSFPSSDVYGMKKDEEPDDGIVTEDTVNEPTASPSRAKSYIYGMETLNGSSINGSSLNGAPLSGTGSLESRSKHVNNSVLNRNEDWYNRRKSYGFEQVQHHQGPSSISSKNKSKVESSTDSGICRSSEIVLKNDLDDKYLDSGINPGSVKKFSTLFEQNSVKKEVLNWKNGDIESTTIRIPIGQNQRPLSDGMKLASNTTAWIKPEENKRHSIAVDEYKYVNNKNKDDKYRRTSLAINDTYYPEDGEENLNGRKTKKVEFCKTEVHFTPESGRVNIVETDEKPPPTQNFRRRRRNSGINLNEAFPTSMTNSNLPVLHFGDTSYEKNLYVTNNDDTIYENLIPKKELVSCSTVTINSNNTNTLQSHMEEIREDNDNIKGILKNKPIKPKPYILGEAHDENNDNSLWGVKLKHVQQKEDKPIWRSTVTVRNTFFDVTNDNDEQQPEFQKLLKSLRPTTTTTSSSRTTSPTMLNEDISYEKNYNSNNNNNNNNMRHHHHLQQQEEQQEQQDTRRSSWSVADRVKQVEDLQWTENKGYSTKVTIGEGDAIVVENLTEKERHPTWPRKDDSFKDLKKQVLKKGLVVRIGRDDTTNSKHTVCSKTTTTNRDNLNSTTTTTTKITIDLTPSPTKDTNHNNYNDVNNKINNNNNTNTNSNNNNNNDILFQSVRLSDTTSHSFKSTSLILNTINNNNNNNNINNNSNNNNNKTTIEKIPQQLEALRKLYEDVQSDSEADKEVQSLMSKNEDNIDLMNADDTNSVVSGSWSKMRSFKNISQYFNKTHALHAHIDKGIATRIDNTKLEETSQHEKINNKNITRSKSSPVREKYSPSLIRRYNNKSNNNNHSTNDKLSSPSMVNQNSIMQERQMVTKENVKPSSQKTDVLRVPKKSEMAYFGVQLSPKPFKKRINEKPDLLQFNKSTKNDREEKCIEPTYENVETLKKEFTSRKNEFDSSILEELTKAADQIMQAVKSYADDDCNKSGTDDDRYRREPLDTISETKSWKTNASTHKKTIYKDTGKSKLKSTSSNSSIESFTRECRKTSTPIRKSEKTSSFEKQPRKKSNNETNNNVKAITRARRLQRASSREALLQSHGSSSEDLPRNTDVQQHRKPRLIKRTKTTQLTMTNGIELKKKSHRNTTPEKQQHDDNLLDNKEERYRGVRQIRHKTAVSTIKSTAEKVASRERTKSRTDDIKKKSSISSSTRKETVKAPGIGLSKSDRNRSVTPKETINHRVSSAITRKSAPSKANTTTTSTITRS